MSWLYLLLLMIILVPSLCRLSTSEKEITWQKLETDLLPRKAVDKIEIENNEVARIYLKSSLVNDTSFKDAFSTRFSEKSNPGPHYTMIIGSVETFEEKMRLAQVNVKPEDRVSVRYLKKDNWFYFIGTWLFPLLILVIFWIFILRRGGAGGGTPFMNFGKSTATLMENENKSTVTFDDVAGLGEAENEVKEIVDFLKDPSTYTSLGAKIPKGMIIVGPPGTGKTLLVKAVAGEANVPFFSISGSEFVELFVGVGASRVRDLFKRAKEKAPCIVFIDEIDAVGRSRSRNAFYSGANDERESTLNQLLTEMDGFSTNSGVIVLAATNRADMLDPALLRPGRFDRTIYLDLPNMHERKEIFEVHLRPLVLDESINLDYLAGQTPGFSGADIANICNEAALIAARRNKEKVTMDDFISAIDRVIGGLEKKTKIISPEEKKVIAYHEAGHAVVSWKLDQVDPLVKVSIIPRGKSLGAAWYLPEEKQLRTKTAFMQHLSATLAGRATEELIFNEVSSGALDDLEKVTREAYAMVAYFGFNSKVGNISFYNSSGQTEPFQKPYSEETGKLIDEEVRLLVKHAYEHAKEILTQNKAVLTEVAEQLLKKETLMKEDLEGILGKR